MQPDLGVVIAAAGEGARVGGPPKQFRLLAGVPMLLWSVRQFAARADVEHLVIVLPPSIARQPPEWLAAMVCSRLTLVAGGRSRAESVRLGVEALPLQCVQVLVHDAARPFVEAETIDAVVARVREGDVVLAAMPVADTLKRVNEVQQLVTATIPRSGLWQAQTPQGFPRALAERLFRSAGVENATDESMLAEALDIPVRVIRGSPANFKVTSAEDLRLAEAWAAASR